MKKIQKESHRYPKQILPLMDIDKIHDRFSISFRYRYDYCVSMLKIILAQPLFKKTRKVDLWIYSSSLNFQDQDTMQDTMGFELSCDPFTTLIVQIKACPSEENLIKELESQGLYKVIQKDSKPHLGNIYDLKWV